MIQFSGTTVWNRWRTLSKKSSLCDEHTHIIHPLPETILFFVYSTRFKRESEDLFTILFPAPKQNLAHSRPSTDICQINEFKYLSLSSVCNSNSWNRDIYLCTGFNKVLGLNSLPYIYTSLYKMLLYTTSFNPCMWNKLSENIHVVNSKHFIINLKIRKKELLKIYPRS